MSEKTLDLLFIQSTHCHEWTPEEDGYYFCQCGATKLISAEDAKQLWGDDTEREDE